MLSYKPVATFGNEYVERLVKLINRCGSGSFYGDFRRAMKKVCRSIGVEFTDVRSISAEIISSSGANGIKNKADFMLKMVFKTESNLQDKEFGVSVKGSSNVINFATQSIKVWMLKFKKNPLAEKVFNLFVGSDGNEALRVLEERYSKNRDFEKEYEKRRKSSECLMLCEFFLDERKALLELVSSEEFVRHVATTALVVCAGVSLGSKHADLIFLGDMHSKKPFHGLEVCATNDLVDWIVKKHKACPMVIGIDAWNEGRLGNRDSPKSGNVIGLISSGDGNLFNLKRKGGGSNLFQITVDVERLKKEIEEMHKTKNIVNAGNKKMTFGELIENDFGDVANKNILRSAPDRVELGKAHLDEVFLNLDDESAMMAKKSLHSVFTGVKTFKTITPEERSNLLSFFRKNIIKIIGNMVFDKNGLSREGLIVNESSFSQTNEFKPRRIARKKFLEGISVSDNSFAPKSMNLEICSIKAYGSPGWDGYKNEEAGEKSKSQMQIVLNKKVLKLAEDDFGGIAN